MSNYQKKLWKRGESGNTPILAEDLNKYEDYLFMHDQQIENLTHIPEGSTTADLEVIDGRVGYDGEIFNSLGDAIRGQIEDVYDRMGHPIYPKGTISFENLPSFDVVTVGDMYNISNEFTTDSRFAEGSGKKISAGANVYAIDTNGTMQWDLFAPVNNVVIDSALSDTSGNPVQNKVVTGNVKDLKAHTRTNLLNPTAQTQTINGVTFTNNGDGTYTVNGTASGVTYFMLQDVKLKKGTYKLTGKQPDAIQSAYIYTLDYKFSSDGLRDTVGTIDTDNYNQPLYMRVASGMTLSNEVIKPMLTTDLSATYDDFVQYSGDGELNENVAEIYKVSDRVSDETYTNLLNPTAQTQTINGVTFTNNGDGTYTANGTASGNIWFALKSFTDFSILENTKLVGCPAGGNIYTTYSMYTICYNGSTWLKEYDDYGNGVIISNIPSQANTVKLSIHIGSGTTCNNLLFKPMLTTKLDATYDDFIPYSGSGALNENVQKMYSDLAYINRNNIVKFKEYQVTFDGAEAQINMTNDGILGVRVLSVTHNHSSGSGYAIQFIPSAINPYQITVVRQRWNSGTPMGITTSEIVTLRVNYY